MKIKLDENMPYDLAEFLRSSKHDVETVAQESLSGADDLIVLQKVAEEDRLLMTFDIDFADIRKFPIGSHGGIVVFRLHDQRWAGMKGPTDRLIESGLLEKLKKGLAIVDETRVRSLPPGTGPPGRIPGHPSKSSRARPQHHLEKTSVIHLALHYTPRNLPGKDTQRL